MWRFPTERAYERYAWVVFLALGVFLVVIGFMFAFLPETSIADIEYFDEYAGMVWSELAASDRGVADFIVLAYENYGWTMMGWGVFVLAVALTGYRRGERWAWYTMWFLPISVLPTFLVHPDSPDLLLYTVLFVVALLGLLLPSRKFFPK